MREGLTTYNQKSSIDRAGVVEVEGVVDVVI